MAYTSIIWTQRDRELIEVIQGDPAGQARVEALTLAVALRTWRGLLQTSQGPLAVRGDALGVLTDVVKLRAKEPVLNKLAHDMSLSMAASGLDLRAAHIWSERNVVCDLLSRRTTEGRFDHPELKAAQCMKAKRVTFG